MAKDYWPFFADGDKFRLWVSKHAAERLGERTEWSFPRRKFAVEKVARLCNSRYVRPNDAFDVFEDGLRWSIAVTGQRRGVVITVVPEGWVKEDYSMSDFI